MCNLQSVNVYDMIFVSYYESFFIHTIVVTVDAAIIIIRLNQCYSIYHESSIQWKDIA